MRKVCVLAMVCAAVLPSRIDASELTYQQMGLHDIVTISGNTGSQTVSGSFFAGEIEWKLSGFDDILTTYCVDIFNGLRDPQAVEIDTTDNLVRPAADAGGKAAWLVNSFSSQVSTGLQAAALQVAIWESIYDNDHNLGTGNFQLVIAGSYTGAAYATLIANQATGYLDELYGKAGGGYYTSTATWFQAVAPTGGQDQIATPEPGSLTLLGLGALAARLYRRRASRAPEAASIA